MKEEEKEFCPDCIRHGLCEEELLFIPARDGRLQHLFCAQCLAEYLCDNDGRMLKSSRIICY